MGACVHRHCPRPCLGLGSRGLVSRGCFGKCAPHSERTADQSTGCKAKETKGRYGRHDEPFDIEATALQHSSRSFSVPEILHLIATGRIALPEFQRPFVWEPNRVLELLDSVLNGWPIGSLLLLEGPQPFEIREIDGAPEVGDADDVLYLLDGQQRVTALFHALVGVSKTSYYADFASTDDEGRPTLKWAKQGTSIVERLDSDRIPFAIFASTKLFDAYIQRVSGSVATWMLDTRRLLMDEEARSVAYAIPAIVMDRAISLEALTRIFETLNRTGVRLNAFDLMVAVLYPSGFQLREEWKSARARYDRLEHFDVSGLEILKLIALWQRDIDSQDRSRPASRRVTGVRQRDVLNTPAPSVINHWQRGLAAYDRALATMRTRFGIRESDGLPSDSMILAIAYFLDAGIPDEALDTWYWSTIASQSYAQGANTQVLIDIRPPVSVRDVGSTLDAAEASLNDEARRNKILRLGLRGLAVLRGARDAFTNERIEQDVTELTLSTLRAGRVGFDGASPLGEVVWVTRESARQLRRALPAGSDLSLLLNADALMTQGFPGEVIEGSSVEAVAARASVLRGWLEEVV